MKKILAGAAQGAGCAFMGLGYLVMGGLGLLIHVLTILIAFSVSGIIGAIISLMLPLISQIFWFIKMWSVAGTILNPYCIIILAYIGSWIVIIVGLLVVAYASERGQK